jgi:hypothetical protein
VRRSWGGEWAGADGMAGCVTREPRDRREERQAAGVWGGGRCGGTDLGGAIAQRGYAKERKDRLVGGEGEAEEKVEAEQRVEIVVGEPARKLARLAELRARAACAGALVVGSWAAVVEVNLDELDAGDGLVGLLVLGQLGTAHFVRLGALQP